MRTHEVADQARVNPRTLRYYERRGLLPAPPRSPAGYRDYPHTVIAVVRFIKRTQRLGFTLADAEQLVQMAAGGPDNSVDARTLADTYLAAIDRKIADLQCMRAALDDVLATCERSRAERSRRLIYALDSTTNPPA